MENVACNLCGADDATEFAVVPDLLLDRQDVRARLVRCNACGLVYQNPRPSPDEMGAHYPPSYELYADHRRNAPRGMLRAAYDYGMRKRCRLVTGQVKAGRLLDVGCAIGTFLVAMRNCPGWEVAGVEVDGDTVVAARSQYNLDVFHGTLEEAQFPTAAFDAVTLWDVLEHVHDPNSTLSEVRRVLRPGGVLALRVPNMQSWDARVFGKWWSGIESPRHLFLYTPETLTNTLISNGFDLPSLTTSIGAYMIFVQNVRYWMTGRRIAPKHQKTIARFLYNPVTRLLTAPLFFVPARVGAGPLLVAVTRRPENG